MGSHVVIFNRWQDAYAVYDRYVDHAGHTVTYVTTPAGRGAVPAGHDPVVVLDDPADADAVRAALAPLIRRHGAPEAVIALQERDLAMAAALREEHGTPGRRPARLHHFLDKHAMLLAAQRSGVRVPEFTLATSTEELHAFADRAGWPFVAKRLRGSASQGVQRIDEPGDVEALSVDADQPLLLQEYIPHRIHHVDGYFSGDAVGPWRLSSYLNTPDSRISGPLAFLSGEPVGSVEIDDPRLCSAVGTFLEALLPVMSPDPWVFHLELFIDDSADTPVCTFLEVGCRPGGGDIPFVWREVHGVDLMELEFQVQRGATPRPAPFGPGEPVGGCLLVPLTAPRPCRVLEATPMTGRDPGPYAEAVPEVGEIVADGSVYEVVGGRFRFRGASTREVARQVLTTAADYRLRCEPVAASPVS